MSTISFDDIAALKVGDVIYECGGGCNIEAEIITTPERFTGFDGFSAVKWKAKNTQNGDTISYLITAGLTHYGPRLYRSPQYVKMVGGNITYPLIGAE